MHAMSSVYSDMGSVAACLQSYADTRRMIDESRRLLSKCHANDAGKETPATPPMTCLLCGYEAPLMSHLKFEARSTRNFAEQYPSIDLNQRLRGFGVCQDCMLRYQGERRRVIMTLNRRLRVMHVSPPRVLH